MFKPKEYDFSSIEDFERKFKGYCDWCWGSGFGDCDICRKQAEEYKKKLAN